MRVAVIVLLAGALSCFTYLRLERTGARGWFPMLSRAVAWSALGLLLLNISCPLAGSPARPLVLLDASLSLGAAGGRWQEARDSATRWGEVRLFGDEHPTADTIPVRGRSLLAPALLAASASDRPVIVVTDGEIEDADDLPQDLLARAAVRLFPREAGADLAITRVTGPGRVTAGDSIALDVDVSAIGGAAPDSVTVQVFSGGRRLASRAIRWTNGASGRARVVVASPILGPGNQVLRVTLGHWSDAEPRTDSRVHVVTVAPTPGVVLLAGPADWDSRFLYRALRDVAQLPVRGFAELAPGRWHAMSDLAPVPVETVRRAARRADLLVLKGPLEPFAEGTVARGLWLWPARGDPEREIAGDWYLIADDASPLSGAFLGAPVDSFPPAIQLTPIETGPSDWVALFAQLGRRDVKRPAVVGREEGRVRRVEVAVDGLWRWAFRGGSSEQSYRALVAATTSWLLGGVDPARGAARPVRPVVPNGRPLVFEWVGGGQPLPMAVTWSEPGGPRLDTLRFDGAGRSVVWRQPGEYRYQFAAGGGGTAVVEAYSEELLPRAAALEGREARVPHSAGRASARDWLWLFGLCVLGLAAEWIARRRLGLR